jgi:acetyltransferase-like isoleucine patch superfamily enzyme
MFVEKIIFHVISIVVRYFYTLVYFGKVSFGKGVTFRRRFQLTIDTRAKVTIGENVFFNNDCSINCRKQISIGENCLFGEGVKIYDHNHRFSTLLKDIREQGFTDRTVSVGRNCWVGSNVVILAGAVIGDNCVIGANVVVKGVVPPNTIIQNDSRSYLSVTREERGNK